MLMKEYSMFPKAPGLEPHHKMQFDVTPRTQRLVNIHLKMYMSKVVYEFPFLWFFAEQYSMIRLTNCWLQSNQNMSRINSIIIKSHWQHGFSWPCLSICLYHPSLLAGPPNYILCLHRADVNKFLLVSQHWYICIRVHRRTMFKFILVSWAVSHVLFVLLG